MACLEARDEIVGSHAGVGDNACLDAGRGQRGRPVRSASQSPSAQFVVGGGSGTLRLLGERYPLRVGGVSAGPFGATRVDLVGRAYNMRTAANIHGIYSTVAESGRPGTFRLRNWRGVVLELRGREGVKPSVDLNGLQISLR